MLKIYILLALVIVGCSSSTKYKKLADGEGYSDSELEGIQYVEFKANSNTPPQTALTFAEFRAVEKCRNRLPYFLYTQDDSIIREVTHTTGMNTVPYYGMYSYPYNRRSVGLSGGFGIGFGAYSSESWKVKHIYPQLKVAYICGDDFWGIAAEIKQVSPKELEFIHKDLLGALMVERSFDDKLVRGDIILKVDNQRVDSLWQFNYLFKNLVTRNVNILRDGKRIDVKLSPTNISDRLLKQVSLIKEKMCKLESKYCSKKD